MPVCLFCGLLFTSACIEFVPMKIAVYHWLNVCLMYELLVVPKEMSWLYFISLYILIILIVCLFVSYLSIWDMGLKNVELYLGLIKYILVLLLLIILLYKIWTSVI